MADRLALRISEDWAILYDPNQWIIAKARKRGTGRDWRPLAYIASNKATLRLVLLEMAVVIDPMAQAELETWPERFLDWFARQNAARRAA